MEQLNNQNIITNFNTPYLTSQGSGAFEIKIPQSTITVAKPLSYEFRVAEFVDVNDNVLKVGLQVQVYEHDNYGSATIKKHWTDVPRVRLPFVPDVI